MTRRKGIQLAYPFEESRLLKWTPPYIVQPKLDGERCRALITQDKVTLLSSEENEIVSVPHINEALLPYGKNLTIELDGELYTQGLSFEEIHSVVGRTVNLHHDYHKIQYHIFDIVSEKPQFDRLMSLRDAIFYGEFVRMVPFMVAQDFSDVMRNYDFLISEGCEGMIVRHIAALYTRTRSMFMMKFKPKKSDFYKIVGFNQMVDKYGDKKEMLGSLVLTDDAGSFFSVGSGMDNEFRATNWPFEKAEELIGKICHVQYQHLTERRVPRFPVFVVVIDPTKEII